MPCDKMQFFTSKEPSGVLNSNCPTMPLLLQKLRNYQMKVRLMNKCTALSAKSASLVDHEWQYNYREQATAVQSIRKIIINSKYRYICCRNNRAA